MSTISKSGNDTAVINGIPMVDVANGDWLTITFPNNKVESETGKNGNSIIAQNASGFRADVTIRLIRGSLNDKLLNSLSILQDADLPSFPLLTAALAKRSGNSLGAVTYDTYAAANCGYFERNVDAKANAQGDVEQSVSVYRLVFTNMRRVTF